MTDLKGKKVKVWIKGTSEEGPYEGRVVYFPCSVGDWLILDQDGQIVEINSLHIESIFEVKDD